jgi:Sigma-70, region 4
MSIDDSFDQGEDDVEELYDIQYGTPVSRRDIADALEREEERREAEWVDPASVGEARTFVAEGLEALTPKQRWILQLFYGVYPGVLDGRCYSTREIAGLMGVSHVAVQRAKDRAVEQLRKRLELGGYHLALVDRGLPNEGCNPHIYRGELNDDSTDVDAPPEGASGLAAGDSAQERPERERRAEARSRNLRRDSRLGTRGLKVGPGWKRAAAKKRRLPCVCRHTFRESLVRRGRLVRLPGLWSLGPRPFLSAR